MVLRTYLIVKTTCNFNCDRFSDSEVVITVDFESTIRSSNLRRRNPLPATVLNKQIRSSDSFCEHLPGAGRRARRRTDDYKSVHLPPDSSGGSFLSHVIREKRQNRPKSPATRCCCRRTDKLCRLSTSRGPSEKWFLSRVIRYRKFFLPASSVSWILAKPVVFVSARGRPNPIVSPCLHT